MAHKHTRSHHKRLYPNLHPDQRFVGMGRFNDNGWLSTHKPHVRQGMRVLAEVERRVQAAEAAGCDHVDLLVLPGLAWPVW